MRFGTTREWIRQAQKTQRRLQKLGYSREAARFSIPFEDELEMLDVGGFDFEDFRGPRSRDSRLPVVN